MNSTDDQEMKNMAGRKQDELLLKDIVTRSTVRKIAGTKYFERGEAYFLDDNVVYFSGDKRTLTGTVQGTKRYKVKLWASEKKLDYSCDCPVGQEGAFCKHCVAVGLAWLNEKGDSVRQGAARLKTSEEDLRGYLEKQEKKELIDLLMEQIFENDNLRESLILKLNCEYRNSFGFETFRHLIDRAVNVGDFVHYRAMWDYTRNIDTVVDQVKDYLKNGHAKEVIRIVEYFLKQVEEAIGSADDSDGGMGMVLEDLQEIHLEACRLERPEPCELAKRLFEWEIGGEYDIFYDAVLTYSDVLGEDGIAVYRKLAEEKWKSIAPLKPGDSEDYRSDRFHITRIMEALAEQAGDLNVLVAVKTKDLSSAYHFLEIAELLKNSGDESGALEWAEKGVLTFPERTDARLRDFLANEYHKRKRHNEAMDLMWKGFYESPDLERYKKLRESAKRAKEWEKWREKVICYIKDSIKRKDEKLSGEKRFAFRTDYSELLVCVYIWERDIEKAWKQAGQDGCSRRTWLKLAGLREKQYPADSVKIYKAEIEPTLGQTNNQAYKEAAEYLRKIKTLMKNMGQEKEFNAYLQSLCETYKRKRNFIKLIENSKFNCGSLA